MHIDWWTLALQTVNVLVLLWLLKRFLLQPVAGIIAARQAAAKKLMDEAGAAKAGAEAEREKAAAETAGLLAEREERLKQGLREAAAAKAAVLAEARQDADKLRSAAQAEIARERLDAQAAYGDQARALALDIARRLFTRLPDSARVAGFIDGLAQAVAALPEDTRSAIGASEAVALRAPRGLTAEEEDACCSRLSAALGHPVKVTVTADPDLIAGLEVDTRHALVRNSFRADLDRIAEELNRHDQR